MSIFVTSDLPKKPEVRYRSLAFAVKIDLRKTTWSVTPKRMKFKKNEPIFWVAHFGVTHPAQIS